jgi:hypothetical protein
VAVIEATTTFEVQVRALPVAGFTAVEEPKPESTVEVEHVPVFQITNRARKSGE